MTTVERQGVRLTTKRLKVRPLPTNQGKEIGPNWETLFGPSWKTVAAVFDLWGDLSLEDKQKIHYALVDGKLGPEYGARDSTSRIIRSSEDLSRYHANAQDAFSLLAKQDDYYKTVWQLHSEFFVYGLISAIVAGRERMQPNHFNVLTEPFFAVIGEERAAKIRKTML